MGRDIKTWARESPLKPVYLWGANRWRGLRRLFAYPDTAAVGRVDYDDYWDKKATSGLGILSKWRLKRAEVFAMLVAAGDSVLDLGVGDGALLRYMIDQRGIVGVGLDVSPKAVAFCHANGLDVRLADINQPPAVYMRDHFAGQTFDYIILSEIIEHLPDPESLLRDLEPFVRKGFIISIPNTGFHQHRLRLLFGKFPLQWVVTPGEHLRYWTRADFRWWARQLGYQIAREVPYVGTAILKDMLPGLFAAAFVYVLSPRRSDRGR
jgi:methionine biosynthesis protein MetW